MIKFNNNILDSQIPCSMQNLLRLHKKYYSCVSCLQLYIYFFSLSYPTAAFSLHPDAVMFFLVSNELTPYKIKSNRGSVCLEMNTRPLMWQQNETSQRNLVLSSLCRSLCGFLTKLYLVRRRQMGNYVADWVEIIYREVLKVILCSSWSTWMVILIPKHVLLGFVRSVRAR